MTTATDFFCGMGGSSTGLTAAGIEVKVAANHWARAIETHSANHQMQAGNAVAVNVAAWLGAASTRSLDERTAS